MLIEIHTATPILNTPDFSFAFGGKTGSEIPLNENGHPDCFEFVALKGMVFEAEEPVRQFPEICRIACSFYPKQNLFLDGRFAKPALFFAQPPSLPPADVILKRMIEMTGAPYVWGGNWKAGISELLVYYPPKKPIDDQTSILWTLNGVDCSGLLFGATDGATPRNTSQLVHFGAPVPIDFPLKPLDMLVYPGHVVFVKDEKTTIESKFPFGVIQRDLTTRLWEFDLERKRIENWSVELDPLKFYTVRRFV
jgi:hypothetical protein